MPLTCNGSMFLCTYNVFAVKFNISPPTCHTSVVPPPPTSPPSPVMNVCTVSNTAASYECLLQTEKAHKSQPNHVLPLPPPPSLSVTRHMTMDMLPQRHSPLEYSLETAHTIEVSREEDQNGEFGSFGFTLLNEKPPNVGTIVPGMCV